jgi:hypothetical protein
MTPIDELLEASVTHESLPVVVDPHLRRGAWFSLVVLAVVTPTHALMLRDGLTPETTRPIFRHLVWTATLGGLGEWLFLVGCAALAVAAVTLPLTQGFRHANRSEHVGLAAVVMTAFVIGMPMLVSVVLAVATMVALFVLATATMLMLALMLGGRR